jgi:ribonuclease P protein component
MKKFTFNKAERLTSTRKIGQLLESGRTHTTYPFRIYWMFESGKRPSPVQVAFSVSKKRFKKAVVRNLIKRRIREAYRKHKEFFEPLSAKEKKLSILLVYISDEVLSYSMIEEKLFIALQQLIAHHEKSA